METARRPASSLFRGLTLPALFLIAAPAFAGAVLSTPDAKQPFAMSHRHAELLQVGVGQLGQDLVVDLVLTEYRRVLFEAQGPQPFRDIRLDLRARRRAPRRLADRA